MGARGDGQRTSGPPAVGGSSRGADRAVHDGGSTVFRKQRRGAPAGFFGCEAAGLRWLAQADAVPVVRVVDVGRDHLDLERLVPARPTAGGARELGRGLARLHDAGAAAFGCPPPGWDGPWFFGPLDDPVPFAVAGHPTWGSFHATGRIAPMRRLLAERGRLDPALDDDLRRVEDRLLAGHLDDGDPPARLHGDLWAGNVMWTRAGAVLIDPAAHGGHRETDLAMLDLFGLPGLAEVVKGYQEVHPLRPGWRQRLGLHQLFPVGMHAVLFGGGYVARTCELARRWSGASARG
ncbi:fructosamine kinase family protein [Cellulomonas aerilata]|uniref:Fructosamine kinase n=1 Tax=Cellulomonas aerilata TaxID=515326 RepID=A0A512DFX3_9CELL|nr:fructosamine kinase family protein [Cellulomonas aerilata]GEO35377.1 fructosamine kinase [Cellulomonas aerilata]